MHLKRLSAVCSAIVVLVVAALPLAGAAEQNENSSPDALFKEIEKEVRKFSDERRSVALRSEKVGDGLMGGVLEEKLGEILDEKDWSDEQIRRALRETRRRVALYNVALRTTMGSVNEEGRENLYSEIVRIARKSDSDSVCEEAFMTLSKEEARPLGWPEVLRRFMEPSFHSADFLAVLEVQTYLAEEDWGVSFNRAGIDALSTARIRAEHWFEEQVNEGRLYPPGKVPRAPADWPWGKDGAVSRQKEAARRLNLPVEKNLNIGDVRFEMALIPPGEFLMGSRWSHRYADADQTLRPAEVEEAFYMSKHEVTQSQWKKVMGTNPSEHTGPSKPVHEVNLAQARRFVQKLNEMGQKKVALPTETQWEFAYRAGTWTPFYWGSSSDAMSEYAWYVENADDTPHPVGQKRPNAWGLYDMAGNVFEFTSSPYTEAPLLNGDSGSSEFVIRGGSWRHKPSLCSAAYRGSVQPEDNYGNFGLRIVVTAPREDE